MCSVGVSTLGGAFLKILWFHREERSLCAFVCVVCVCVRVCVPGGVRLVGVCVVCVCDVCDMNVNVYVGVCGVWCAACVLCVCVWCVIHVCCV